MKQYFSIYTRVRKRDHQNEEYYLIEWRECKPTDFSKLGLNISELSDSSQRRTMNLCPDFETYPDLIELLNNYNNPVRTDLSIDFYKCYENNCKSNYETDKLLRNLWFTVSTIQNQVHFENKNGKSLIVENKFHS